ncbi:hypothetical protein RHSIM_Rhsim11G0101200 [Rhododendron simsii]|uniref:Uncharacterized protein n=1 Tax=Rhododendron simsii TaxID=118357 RepID=A0A834GAU9_RHOSS|nr:hypothetical protein RHSIM_Rhsim11G0101200 [Rhododendron simsii]
MPVTFANGVLLVVPRSALSAFRGIEDGIPELRFNMSINYHTNELHGGIEVDGSSKDTKVTKLDNLEEEATKPFHSPVSGITETMNSPSPPTLPTYNHSNSRKRKGIPRRASLSRNYVMLNILIGRLFPSDAYRATNIWELTGHTF